MIDKSENRKIFTIIDRGGWHINLLAFKGLQAEWTGEKEHSIQIWPEKTKTRGRRLFIDPQSSQITGWELINPKL